MSHYRIPAVDRHSGCHIQLITVEYPNTVRTHEFCVRGALFAEEEKNTILVYLGNNISDGMKLFYKDYCLKIKIKIDSSPVLFNFQLKSMNL